MFLTSIGDCFFFKSSWLNHYTTVIQNLQHHQYGCALYMQRTIHTTYVRRQHFVKHMGVMLDLTMRHANVVHRWEIAARIPNDAKNAQSHMEGKRNFDNILRNNVKGKNESSSLIITGHEKFVLIYHNWL